MSKVERAVEKAMEEINKVINDRSLSPSDALEVIEGIESELDVISHGLRDDVNRQIAASEL